jgi:hypothetical protein
MMEEREKQAKEIVENIEHKWATVEEKAERREAMLKAETERLVIYYYAAGIHCTFCTKGNLRLPSE